MHRVLLNVGLAALAVGLGGCGTANEDDAVRAASESDAARETKAALGDGRPSDSFGVTCKKKADTAFACTKYELDKNDPGKFSAADVLGEYETTCVKPDTCKVRVADYTPDMHRRGGP